MFRDVPGPAIPGGVCFRFVLVMGFQDCQAVFKILQSALRYQVPPFSVQFDELEINPLFIFRRLMITFKGYRLHVGLEAVKPFLFRNLFIIIENPLYCRQESGLFFRQERVIPAVQPLDFYARGVGFAHECFQFLQTRFLREHCRPAGVEIEDIDFSQAAELDKQV